MTKQILSIEEFRRLCIVLNVFIIVKEFRPIHSFLTSYLNSPPINLTVETINEDVYPLGTYFFFIFAIPMFFITDYSRYKPIIILDAFTGLMTYVLLLGNPSMIQLCVEQLMYGLNFSSDVACKTYLYAKVEDAALYKKITSYVRTSSLLGRFISGIFSQILFSTGLVNELGLLYISVAGMLFCTFWIFMIPSVPHSIYFHPIAEREVLDKLRMTEKTEMTKEIEQTVKSKKLIQVLHHIWKDFKNTYKNTYILKWSIWCWFVVSGYNFVTTNNQILWQIAANKSGGSHSLMNGAIRSLSTILCIVPTFLISKLIFSWRKYGDIVLIFITLALSALMMCSYACESLWLLYLLHITYNLIYQTMLTVAHAEIAQYVKRDSLASIFGFNNFVAAGLTSLTTYVIITKPVIHLNIREQFCFLGMYHFILSMGLLVKTVAGIKTFKKTEPENI